MLDINTKMPGWFWPVSALLLVWYLCGTYLTIMELSLTGQAYLDRFGQAALGLREIVPKWSMGGYVIGVWTGLLATIMLLLRKPQAISLYIISLIGALVGCAWYVMDERPRSVLNDDGGWLMIIVVLAICLFAIWFSRFCKKRGLLK